MKILAPALVLVLSHTAVSAQQGLADPLLNEAHAAAPVEQLRGDLHRAMMLLADAQVELYEIRQILPEMRILIGTLQDQNKKMQELLISVCGQKALDREPICVTQIPPPQDNASEVEALQDEVASLRATLDILKAEVEALGIGGKGHSLSDGGESYPTSITPGSADDTLLSTGQDLAPAQPYEIDKMPTGQPSFPMRQEIDGQVAALPSEDHCPEAGAWLIDHVKDRVDNILFVNAAGSARVCKLVHDGWQVLAARRVERAYVIWPKE